MPSATQNAHARRSAGMGMNQVIPKTHTVPPSHVGKGGQGNRLVGVIVDIIYRLADRGDLLGVFVADLDVELFFERHDHLDEIERVGVEVFGKRSVFRDIFLLNTELIGDDGTELCQNLFF